MSVFIIIKCVTSEMIMDNNVYFEGNFIVSYKTVLVLVKGGLVSVSFTEKRKCWSKIKLNKFKHKNLSAVATLEVNFYYFKFFALLFWIIPTVYFHLAQRF